VGAAGTPAAPPPRAARLEEIARLAALTLITAKKDDLPAESAVAA